MAEIVIINPRFDTSYWGLEAQLLRAVRRRPASAILQLYALKCAMHFHVRTEVLSAEHPAVRTAAA